MSNEVAIKVENINKCYRLYNTHLDRLKEALSPLRKKYHHDFFALRNINFEVMRGESIGIIGKNGSGKSTLLKLLSGILTPSNGTVSVNGRISALLELGTGFNPELTGIENVVFNCTLMGFSKEIIESKIDSILSFADIGEFINQPVKTYSSGMFVRLAFAVAVNIEPDILVIDEALAVGDLRFQKKCKSKMNEFKENGVTQVIVSHTMTDITTSCNKALYLKDGTVEYYGDVREAVSIYMEHENESSTESLVATKMDIDGTGDVTVHNIYCYQRGCDKNDKKIQYGQNIVVEVEYEAYNSIIKPLIRVNLSVEGYKFFTAFDYKLAEYGYDVLVGQGVIKIEIIAPNIYPGSYFVNVAFLSEEMNCHFFRWNDACRFTIVAPNGVHMIYPRSLIHLDAQILEIK